MEVEEVKIEGGVGGEALRESSLSLSFRDNERSCIP